MHIKLTEQGLEGSASYLHIGAQCRAEGEELRRLYELLKDSSVSELIQLVDECLKLGENLKETLKVDSLSDILQ